jgi:hypothetical protein
VIPYPKTRYRVAVVLEEDESYLWPSAVNGASLAGAELVATYPRRSDVPRDLWMDLLRAASRNIDLLAFAGLFLTEEHPEWLPTLAEKAEHPGDATLAPYCRALHSNTAKMIMPVTAGTMTS